MEDKKNNNNNIRKSGTKEPRPPPPLFSVTSPNEIDRRFLHPYSSGNLLKEFSLASFNNGPLTKSSDWEVISRKPRNRILVRNAAKRNLNSPILDSVRRERTQQEDELQTLFFELSCGAVGPQLESLKDKILKKLKNKTERIKIFDTTERSTGQTILHICIQHCPDLVPILLKKRGNFDLNKKDIYGASILCISALIGNEGIFTKLLNAGCKPDQKTLQYFCSNFCSDNCPQLFKNILTKGGISVNGKTGEENTPLHASVSNKREDMVSGINGSILMVDLLLQNGADINAINHRHDTALHWAVFLDNIPVAKFLVLKGADLSLPGREGLSPVQFAEKEKKIHLVRFMKLVDGLRRALSPKHLPESEIIVSEEICEQIVAKFVEHKMDVVGISNLSEKMLDTMGIKHPGAVSKILRVKDEIAASMEIEKKTKNIPSDYYLEGDSLSEIVELFFGPNIIGKKNFSSVGNLNKQELEIYVEDSRVEVRLGEQSSVASSVRRMESGEVIPIKKNQSVILNEGDSILLTKNKHTLILMKRLTINAFALARLKELAPWLKTIPLSTFKKSSEELEKQKAIFQEYERRLDYRLHQSRFKRIEELASITKDKDCLFFSISYQLFDSTTETNSIRQAVVNWLRANPNFLVDGKQDQPLSSFVKNETWEQYCCAVENGYGDGLTLLAIVEEYGVSITVITGAPVADFLHTILPRKNETSPRSILLALLPDLYFQPLSPIIDVEAKVEVLGGMNIDPSEVEVQDMIGHGSSGTVYLATWRGFTVCAKKIKNTLMSGKKRIAFLQEVHMLRKLRHPNIILFMGTMEKRNDLYIITEYMERKSLAALFKSNGVFDWKITIRMATDVARGMHYLHSSKPMIIHRDLKSGNILVDKDLNLKICDFGVAKFLPKERRIAKTLYTTIAWTAPEILREEGYTEKADIFSYSLVLWALITGEEPHEDKTEFQIILGVLKEELRPPIPQDNEPFPEYIQLMKQCWDTDPEKRPSFDSILKSLAQIIKSLPEEPVTKTNSGLSNSGSNNFVGLCNSDYSSSEFLSPTSSQHNLIEHEDGKNLQDQVAQLKHQLEEERNLRGFEGKVNLKDITTKIKTISTNFLEHQADAQQTLFELWQLEKTFTEALERASKGLDVGVGTTEIEEGLSLIRQTKASAWESTKTLPWKIDFSELQFDREKDELGAGSSATVYKGQYRKQKVAIKLLNITPDLEEFKKELDILCSVRSPNIVFFYGASVHPEYALITELMERGSVKDVLCNPNYKFNWKRMLKFATQSVQALLCLHSWTPTVVHRDIKTQNLLVNKDHIVKLADLGLARFTTFQNRDTLFQARGSLAYMAPEVWSSAGFTPKSDIYSMSIVLWEMVHRSYFGTWSFPYPGANPLSLITKVSRGMRPKIDEGMPSTLVKLITTSWESDPDKRPTTEALLDELNQLYEKYESNPSEWDKYVAPTSNN